MAEYKGEAFSPPVENCAFSAGDAEAAASGADILLIFTAKAYGSVHPEKVVSAEWFMPICSPATQAMETDFLWREINGIHSFIGFPAEYPAACCGDESGCSPS
jgi:hypothetical protein